MTYICYHNFSHYICRQHWFISRMNGGSVTSGGFCPKNNTLVITTSKNEVYVFDVEAKQLGEWSKRYTHQLPRSFQEFPGEVIGLSFPPQSSSSVVVYSTRYFSLKYLFLLTSFCHVAGPSELIISSLGSLLWKIIFFLHRGTTLNQIT
jgi:hypothetical protein